VRAIYLIFTILASKRERETFLNLNFIGNFRSEVQVLINSRTSSIHGGNIEQSKGLFNMLLCGNRCAGKKQKMNYIIFYTGVQRQLSTGTAYKCTYSLILASDSLNLIIASSCLTVIGIVATLPVS
jgi:hypothetical protein